MNPKQLARIGLIYLEEAVLDALSHEAAKPEIISKRIGIPPLKEKGQVERCDDARWKLTEPIK